MTRRLPIRGADRGSVIVIPAVFLPVALIFAAFVVDVGNWWVHKRHLQKTADAGVLAAAAGFSTGCATDLTVTDAAIKGLANKYAGAWIPRAPAQAVTF